MTDPESPPTLVVGIGASAGGFTEFTRLLRVLPPKAGMAFVVVPHLDPPHPGHPGTLTELLAPSTSMRVVDAAQGAPVEPNTVYVIPPDTALGVSDRRIELSAPTRDHGVQRPVDHLFVSLAREYGPRAAAVVLSGAGSDGCASLRDIRSHGGLVIAQDPGTSEQPGMPGAAIDTGVVDLVLDIDEIPGALTRFASMPPAVRTGVVDGPERPDALTDAELGRLAAVLDAQRGFDLRVYKPASVGRRVLRRMALDGFDSSVDYVEHLREDASARDALVCDLMIGVTDFYRDRDAFAALRELVIAPSVEAAPDGATLRAWVPGCATGEEAYTIAIEFLEAIRTSTKRARVQVFATDIDDDALTVARRGIYGAAVAERLPRDVLDRYFRPYDDQAFQIRPDLRDAVSFAVHDLTKDPPFSRMCLVSCRNVLIYLTADAQKHVLAHLHFALERDGCLFLSTSESAGSMRDLFGTVSKAQRIYRKLGPSHALSMSRTPTRPREREGSSPGISRGLPKERGRDLARRAVLDALVPPTIVVSEDGTVVFTHGELSAYLQIPQGERPRLELGAVLRPELATRARSALYKCRRSGQRCVTVSSPDAGLDDRVRITATSVSQLGDDAVALSFESLPAEAPHHPTSEPATEPGNEAVIGQLEQELAATRDDLRSAIEELGDSNKKLRTSHEESVSMNEELQSANEELEATTEELRSLNEEMTTVNAQLRENVQQLEEAHDDLHNLFASTKIATVFLDDELRVKRFTPAARELLALDDADVGRPVGTIARELLRGGLEDAARKVLGEEPATITELETGEGWVSRQILPYRTEARHIEGVVVTFLDITDLKATTQRLSMREHQQRVIAQLTLRALEEADLRAFMDHVVRDVHDTLRADFTKILELQPGGDTLLMRAGVGWQAGLVGAATVPAGGDSQAGYTLQSNDAIIVSDLADEHRFSGPALLTEHGVVSGMSAVIRTGQSAYGVIGAHTTQPRKFTREDANFLQLVASVIGSAITRHQTRNRIVLEAGVHQALAEVQEWEPAVDQLLGRLAAHFRASLAECWCPAQGQGALRCQNVHLHAEHDRDELRQQLLSQHREASESLVARVFATGEARWCTEFGSPDVFEHQVGRDQLGIVSAVALPVNARGHPLGVITVFAARHLFVDPFLLRSLESVGRSIGDYLERASAEHRVLQLAAVTASSQDAILTYELDGTVTGWLSGAHRLFGYTAEQMIGRSIETIVPEARRDELWAANRRIIAGELLDPFETVRIRADGTRVEVSVQSSPIRNAAGRVVGISSSDRDITMQKSAERTLIEADNQKDEFLAMLGHELRNPLAAIQSGAEVLGHIESSDPRLSQTQAILARQSKHMAKLLDGLLDVSRIIRGKIRLERDTVDFGDICREVATDAMERRCGRDIHFDLNVPDDPLWVHGDPVRLTQIVDNLVSNAVKYTSDGGRITVDLSASGDTLTLELSDTGIGIEADLLPHIFRTFRQSKQSLDRAEGGLGLGLALVKWLVELHGGSVAANSEGRGRGSSFVVRLPASAPPVRSRAAFSGRAQTGARLLVIEDDPDAAEMLRQLLELAGHEVDVAGTGPEGIALARKVTPDVVLCDLGLPDGMSGFDVARALRSDPATKCSGLVALSGYGRPEDKAEGVDAGFDAHLTKPVDLDALGKVIDDLRTDATSARRLAGHDAEAH